MPLWPAGVPFGLMRSDKTQLNEGRPDITLRIAHILREGGSADDLVRETIALGFENQDNVTTLVVRVLEDL